MSSRAFCLSRGLLGMMLVGGPVLGCSSNSPSVTDGSAPDGVAAAGGFGVTLRASSVGASAAPAYPYDPLTGEHRLYFRYRAILQPGSQEKQDLRMVFPTPKVLGSPSKFTISGGWYNSALGAGLRVWDWLAPEMGPMRVDVVIERDPKLFSDEPASLRGDLEVKAQVEVTQYDQVVATSNEAVIKAYLPAKVSAQNFEYQNSGTDGTYLYVSGKARSGEWSGKGGVYRVAIADGTVSQLVQHPKQPERITSFAMDGDTLYFAEYSSESSQPDLLMKVAVAGGTPQPVPIAMEVNNIFSIAADATSLYVVLEKKGGGFVLHRMRKDDPTQDAITSPGFGRVVPETIAVTQRYVVVLQEEPGAVVRFDKTTLTPMKLMDVGSTTGRRSLVCNEMFCFWTEWTAGGLYQIALDGTGSKSLIGSTNQAILYDGKHIYSGINGLIRVGPSQNPPQQMLFRLGGPIPVLALDAQYVYFSVNDAIWKLHK